MESSKNNLQIIHYYLKCTCIVTQHSTIGWACNCIHQQHEELSVADCHQQQVPQQNEYEYAFFDRTPGEVQK